jgi:hypothetical protein
MDALAPETFAVVWSFLSQEEVVRASAVRRSFGADGLFTLRVSTAVAFPSLAGLARRFPRLRHLDLVDEDDEAALPDCCMGCDSDDKLRAVADAVAVLPALRRLRVDVQPETAEPLADAHGGTLAALMDALPRGLEELFLAGTNLSDGQLAALGESLGEGDGEGEGERGGGRISLSVLNLRGNGCAALGGAALGAALRSGALRGLTELSLHGNPLGPDGARALSAPLRAGCAPLLCKLNVGDCSLGAAGGAAVAAALPRLRRLVGLDIR